MAFKTNVSKDAVMTEWKFGVKSMSMQSCIVLATISTALANVCCAYHSKQNHDSAFDWLPLAAEIENEILCLHGGPGATLVSRMIAFCKLTATDKETAIG